jgi:hypothetical protein
MAVNNLDFSVTVDNWVKATNQRITAVWKESTQRLNSVVVQNLSGGLVNVQTGFLRASERASTDEMPSIVQTQPKPGSSYPFDGGQISAVIAGAQLGQTIYLGWTANYAPHIEYGTQHMAPRPFIGMAVLQWPVIVNGVVQEAKSRAA